MNQEFTAKALDGLNMHTEPHWARTCGLVRGTAQVGGVYVYRYACCKCEIVLEVPCDEADAEATPPSGKRDTVKDPLTDKGWVPAGEMVARERFKALAKEKGCTHLEQRLLSATQSPAHKVFGAIALMKLGVPPIDAMNAADASDPRKK